MLTRLALPIATVCKKGSSKLDFVAFLTKSLQGRVFLNAYRGSVPRMIPFMGIKSLDDVFHFLHYLDGETPIDKRCHTVGKKWPLSLENVKKLQIHFFAILNFKICLLRLSNKNRTGQKYFL